MNSRLQGITAKIQRAEENIRNLNTEITAFLSRNPNLYDIRGEFENGGLEYVVKGYGKPDIPLRFSVLAGEIIHHLKSVFDHLICALIVEQGGTPTAASKFPVCFKADKFIKTCQNGCINGVSDSAVDIIEKTQPYHAVNPATTVLGGLTEWDNIDKHRLLILTVGIVTLGERINIGNAKNSPDDPELIIAGISTPDQMFGVASNEGVEILRLFLASPCPTLQVEPEVATQIALQIDGVSDYFEVIKTLTEMLQGTIGTVKKFRTEFRAVPWE